VHVVGATMTALDEAALGAFVDAQHTAAGDHLFRMERLPRYAVPHQSAELARWRRGETEPDRATKQPWLETLADEAGRGLISRRVRVFGVTLSDDELRACHWGYALNSRHEDIRVLRRGEHDLPEDLIELDYWIVVDRHVLPMHYDEDGRFLGAEVAAPGRLAEFRRDRERAWAVAEPFPQWWSRHPELHRPRAA
jgi:hypothetical protein